MCGLRVSCYKQKQVVGVTGDPALQSSSYPEKLLGWESTDLPDVDW